MLTARSPIQIALQNGVTIKSTLQMVRDARKLGVRAPILLMGYYNPLLSYGEERLMKDCIEAGVNGFIIVDLPPEEAVTFRRFCSLGGYASPASPSPPLLETRLTIRAQSFVCPAYCARYL